MDCFHSGQHVNPQEVRRLLFARKTERDRQANIGPSELGGCARKVWHRLDGTPETNTATIKLPARMGTAFHSWIEHQLQDDPRFLLETRIERDGMTGHVDCFDLETNTVIDWKTSTVNSTPYFPSKQQRWQVQVYGWLMEAVRPVEAVCLVMIPRDGTEHDIVTHREPYDPRVAAEALAWLEDIRQGSQPKPGKKKKFCRDYCQFYDPTGIIGCQGL